MKFLPGCMGLEPRSFGWPSDALTTAPPNPALMVRKKFQSALCRPSLNLQRLQRFDAGLNLILADRPSNDQESHRKSSNQRPVNESEHLRLDTRWRGGGRGRHLASGEGRRRWWSCSDGGSRMRTGRAASDEKGAARKNAVMVLKESIPQLEYTLLRATGPCHAPTYTVQTVINGQAYLGCGRTKRKARMEAATRAVLSSIQFPDSFVTHEVIQSYLPPSIDFTADSFHDWSTTTAAAAAAPEVTDPLERSGETVSKPVLRRRQRTPDLTEVPWNPVSILNDIRPQSKYRRVSPPGVASGGDRKRRTIRISVTFDGMTFDGVGRSQRTAKQRAAQAALKEYFDLRFIGSVRSPPNTPPSSFSSNAPTTF